MFIIVGSWVRPVSGENPEQQRWSDLRSLSSCLYILGTPWASVLVLVVLVGGGAPSVFHLLLSANRSRPPHIVSVVDSSEKHPQSLTFPLIPCGDSIGHYVTPAFPCLQGWISCVFLLGWPRTPTRCFTWPRAQRL